MKHYFSLLIPRNFAQQNKYCWFFREIDYKKSGRVNKRSIRYTDWFSLSPAYLCFAPRGGRHATSYYPSQCRTQQPRHDTSLHAYRGNSRAKCRFKMMNMRVLFTKKMKITKKTIKKAKKIISQNHWNTMKNNRKTIRKQSRSNRKNMKNDWKAIILNDKYLRCFSGSLFVPL